MTEEEWLSSCAVPEMLAYLSGMASDRKVRLLMSGCCRRLERRLVPLLAEAVEVAERFADGEATDDERKDRFESICLWYQGTFRREADGSCHAGITRRGLPVPVALALMTERDVVTINQTNRHIAAPGLGVLPFALEIATQSCFAAACADALLEQIAEDNEIGFVKRLWRRLNEPGRHAIAIPWEGTFLQWRYYSRSFSKAASLLRDVFGNPFRPAAIDPAWLTSTLVALARGIYDDRAFDRMPILGDALEDAGCDNADILAHCRDANATHVRGCWVVDLVLGKE
jgi:hypothetical protein